MSESAKKKAVSAGRYGADATIIVLVTLIVISFLRQWGVTVEDGQEEMIIAAAVLLAGRIGLIVNKKISDKQKPKP